jgi:hypothetical protein
MDSENKGKKEKLSTKEENSDSGTAGLFPTLSLPILQSCGSDSGIETDKDSATTNDAVDSSHADEQVK